MANHYDKILTDIASAASSKRQISIAGSADRALGTQAECPRCRELIEYREMGHAPHVIRYWSDCSCWLMQVDDARARNTRAQDHASDYRAAPILCDVRAYQGFTFDTFDPARLANGDKLLLAGRTWLEKIEPLPFADRTYASPRCCLYFYSAGKGRGKTHLAAAMALAARAAGKTIAIVDEISYAEQYWAADLEHKRDLALAPSERAWLTVFDGMGDRENTPAGLRDFWYDLLGPRWLKRGWTIVTSNLTPDELVAHGTIDDRVYSRLIQMCGDRIVTFDGTDQRLVTE